MSLIDVSQSIENPISSLRHKVVYSENVEPRPNTEIKVEEVCVINDLGKCHRTRYGLVDHK